MVSFSEISKKKVAGIPVLYLAAAFVVILALVAWKMKSTTPTDTGTGGNEDTPTDNTPTDTKDPDYSGLATKGTVTVVQATTSTDTSDPETNSEWERSAVAYLIEAKLATASDAQSAIHKYLEGSNLSYDEGKLKDAAITKLKLPPQPLTTIGTIGGAPAQKQFSNFPGKHTVKGTNDNTASKLATLYYGSGDALHANRIAASNVKLGPVGTTYTTGTVVFIPMWANPKYYTVKSYTVWPSQVAQKNGKSYNEILYLNPGLVAPYKVGSKVRVF